MSVNWNEVNRCSIWKVLGVTECDNCDSNVQCWGEETILPEMNDNELRKVFAQTQVDDCVKGTKASVPNVDGDRIGKLHSKRS